MLVMDSTTVANKLGSEIVSISPGSRKHKGTKIHVIATAGMIPLGVAFSDAKTHDIKMVISTIKTIKISTSGATIVADKGYVDEKIRRDLKAMKINFLAVPKKGMKRKLTHLQKLKMQNRHKIENLFAHLKVFRRLSLRMDRTMNSFSSFCYIALLATTIKLN